MQCIDPLKTFGTLLNKINAPSRYLSLDYGATVKKHDGEELYNFAMAFPDLYEIGMSNLAVKIIYNGLNALDSVRCERVFSPDVDFEKLLREKEVPLYTLETGMPLCDVDMIGFSIGYELGITQVLAMLETGHVPLLASERTEENPIVVAGGCGVTNPAPIAAFFDALIIGEAEDGMFEMVAQLSKMKRNGATRAECLAYIESLPFMWTAKTAAEGKIAKRAVQGNFGFVPSVPSWFPMPTIKPVQDHGVIEIMRGCPNGCRFCHAGVYYRPDRAKALPLIIDEIDHLVFDAGYREVSLNSLSSADYPDIEGLLDILNERYKGYNVSFQLPSLKVNSFSLPLLEKLSQVRKSGLTFAVETPEELWQLSLNKEVYAQHLAEVILEAKKRGWSSAKFYFMVGLPVGDYFFGQGEKSEEEAIADFLIELQQKTRIQCNVNVGVFIPKPHTAYQWVRQITPEDAKRKLDYLFQRLPRGKFKLGRHNFDTTILEGLLSRGAESVSNVVLSAYKKGARFDAWDEHLKENMPLWNEAFAENNFDVRKELFKDWDVEQPLPWDSVSLGPSKNFFKREWKRSIEHVLTPRCEPECTHRCGVCTNDRSVSCHNKSELENISSSLQNNTLKTPPVRPDCNIPVLYRVIFSFSRSVGAEFVAYLSQVELFHKAFLRSGLPVVFTAGFNPIPRVEFATALTLGLCSEEEIVSCLLYDDVPVDEFMEKMNCVLPPEFKIRKAFIFAYTNMLKREALSQSLWGGQFEFDFGYYLSKKIDGDSFVCNLLSNTRVSDFIAKNALCVDNLVVRGNLPVGQDKAFRVLLEELSGQKWYELCAVKKLCTLARSDESDVPVTFWKLYEHIAALNAEAISQKDEFEKMKAQFYRDHPDVLERHLKNKAKKSSKAEKEKSAE